MSKQQNIDNLQKAIANLSKAVELAILDDSNDPKSDDANYVIFNRMQKYVDLLKSEMIHF